MQTIYLDISNKGIIPTINAKQNDVGRTFQVLLFENGIPYNAAENSVSFFLWYSGASGDGNYDTIWTKVGQVTEGRYAFLIDNNSVIVELATQMLTNAGSGQMCLTMKDTDGKTVGLWNIPYSVEEVPGYPSENAKPYYPKFVQSVNGVAPDETGNVTVDTMDEQAVQTIVEDKLRDINPVLTVNGVEPDENGNVELEVGGGSGNVYIGPEQPTDGTLYWLDTSGEIVETVEYAVTANLSHVTSDNNSATVNEGESYSATLTANDGYKINSVTVEMGGVDVTATVYSDGVITISSVTGNVVITAIAVTEDAGVDLSEENIFRSIDGPRIEFAGDEWTAFMELDVEKLYFYVPQSDQYGRSYNVAAKYTPSWGYHTVANMTAADAAKKENNYITNGWDKLATDGYDVVEIDVKAVQDTVRQMYNAGELDETKSKIIIIEAAKILAGGTAYLLYNYGG